MNYCFVVRSCYPDLHWSFQVSTLFKLQGATSVGLQNIGGANW